MDLTPLYPWLKTGHILLAIVAVGFNLTYGILIRRDSPTGNTSGTSCER